MNYGTKLDNKNSGNNLLGSVVVLLLIIISSATWTYINKKNDAALAEKSGAEDGDSSEYLDATARTAFGGKMDVAEFRSEISTLARRCKRDKTEIYQLVRKLSKSTYDLKYSLSAVPALCDAADARKIAR